MAENMHKTENVLLQKSIQNSSKSWTINIFCYSVKCFIYVVRNKLEADEKVFYW